MYEHIPAEMRAYDQWVCWRFEDVGGGKPTKVPYNPRTGYPADITDKSTWNTFDYVVQAVTQPGSSYSGIGFAFADSDPFCGIDLDTPYDSQGKLELSPDDIARHELIFKSMESYSERSPSKNGLHIITKAKVPHGRKRANIEVYSSGRYFTMTGDVYANIPIADRQELVNILWSEMGASATPNYYAGDWTEKHTDAEIYDMASKARNGDLFLRLWNGDGSGYFSQSEADFALIDIIAFYTKHRMQITRMFMSSEFGKREKYTKAKSSRLSSLLGYMINKSFDRMLPDVDLSGIIDQVNAARASFPSQPVPASVGAGHNEPVGPRAAFVPDQTPPDLLYDGMSVNLWRTLPPPGTLGLITNYIYQSAPRPVYEIALAAALGLMSGITGRSYNVSGTGLNHYIMLLAFTGAGKDAMDSGINSLMAAVATEFPSATQFIGPAEIASGQALLKHMSDRPTPCFLSLVGEIGLRLQQMTNPNASSSEVALKRVLLDIFGKSGENGSIKPTIYSDKKNNTDIIHSPAFSLLGDTTPSTFYKALDEDLITQGLLPRFTIIEYDGPRVPMNFAHTSVKPSYELGQRIIELVKTSHEATLKGKVIHVKFTPDADQMLRDMDEYTLHKINASDRDVIRQLWNRFDLKIIKIAAILAISYDAFEPTITVQMLEWARSLILTDTLRLINKFETGQIGANNDVKEQDDTLRLAIKQYLISDYSLVKQYDLNAKMFDDKVVPYVYVQRRLVSQAVYRKAKGGGTLAIKQAVQNLIDAGVIQEVPPSQLREKYGFNGRAYGVLDAKWLLK